MMIFKSHFYIYAFLSSIIMLIGCTDNDMPIKDKEEEKNNREQKKKDKEEKENLENEAEGSNA